MVRRARVGELKVWMAANGWARGTAGSKGQVVGSYEIRGVLSRAGEMLA